MFLLSEVSYPKVRVCDCMVFQILYSETVLSSRHSVPPLQPFHHQNKRVQVSRAKTGNNTIHDISKFTNEIFVVT